MKRFLTEYRLHEHTEALFLLSLGLITQVLDGSPLDLKDRWDVAWQTDFPREYFSVFAQRVIKTVLSVIIFVRCLTSAFYVLFGLIVFFCIVRETAPKLMLPWLFIAGLKSVLLTFLEALTGIYVCSALGKIRKPCLEFMITKAVELFFSIYLWACIRSIHNDLERCEDDKREEELLKKMVLHRVNYRRRRSRSMIDETTLSKTAHVNYFELKDVPNIIFDMLKTEEELSQDSLFSPGMMLTSVSNMGSFDYLKTSLSLGELGYLDLNSFQVIGLDDERNLSPCERAMKFLKVTRDDIKTARARTRERPVMCEPLNICSLLKKKPRPTYERLPREKEIFMTHVPSPPKMKDLLLNKNNIKYNIKKYRNAMMSRVSFKSDDESKSSEEFISLEDGEIEEGDSPPSEEESPDLWFMTNRTADEVTRVGLLESHYVKGSDNYERLYRQEYMSVVGPEVFDKASKLVKLTSLTDINTASRKYLEAPYSYVRIPPLREELEMSRPSTSADAKQKKRIMFEDHRNDSTAMPLRVILTNFPLKFDSRFTQCEAIYYRETVTNAPTVTDGEPGLQIPNRPSIADEGLTLLTMYARNENHHENRRLSTALCTHNME
ncbi:UNVERIFIED_CONTAM: hypothetical protein PYX00_000399 [Menopon gallinae]|uniref:Uncharacterized protein n=1 Tax=Menopon gallinae TaxID=328185 RepID=A0AAW2IA67_9NEOP